MNTLVLKGDMDVTFAGIVDIGEFNFWKMNFAMNKTDSLLNPFPETLPNTQFPINFNITFACADKEVALSLTIIMESIERSKTSQD